MGNTRSAPSHDEDEDIWWNNEPKSSPSVSRPQEDDGERTERRKRAKEELDEFKLELARKHEKRRQLIAEKQREMKSLREEVQRLREENEELRGRDLLQPSDLHKENQELRAAVARMTNELTTIDDIRRRNLELKTTIAQTQRELQELNAEVVGFEKERQDYKNHVVALKDVIAVSKQMLLIRENQLKELKQKVSEIEASLAGKELSALSQDLQKEYEKQLQNMKNLRAFYEERLRAHAKEKQDFQVLQDATKKELQEEQARNGELKETIERLEDENSRKYDEIKSLESNLGLTKAECRQYQAELSVINQLFSQILLGFNNNQEVDIDKLVKLLEENHHLLQDIAVNEVSNEVASALPKVLLDLVSEASDKDRPDEEDEQKLQKDSEPQHQLNSASEIVENLPKVWRVLIELLSHQCAPVNVLSTDGKGENPCYKVVETPKGPHLALSVSKTFIRLKDLILEKKSLERETFRLKHLNTHLECRLQEQEKRLEVVSNELTETWHVVGKLQKKHQLLHTQEKILRYELAQKRKLLNELKEELEYSREKWLEAREKNSNTERQWEQLRTEFASRKSLPEQPENGITGVIQDEIATIEDPTETESTEAGGEGEAGGAGGTDLEKVLSAREERLQRLEGQCSSLVRQMASTSNRGAAMCNKLDALHEIYGDQGRREGEESVGLSGEGAETSAPAEEDAKDSAN